MAEKTIKENCIKIKIPPILFTSAELYFVVDIKERLPKDRCFSIAFRIFAVVCNRKQSASFPIKRGKRNLCKK